MSVKFPWDNGVTPSYDPWRALGVDVNWNAGQYDTQYDTGKDPFAAFAAAQHAATDNAASTIANGLPGASSGTPAADLLQSGQGAPGFSVGTGSNPASPFANWGMGASTPPPTNAGSGQPGGAGASGGASGGAGAAGAAKAASAAGAAWGADGGYRLPSGEVLPGYAHSTVDINGKQVTIPGYYEPDKDASIFQNGTRAESAMGRLVRRLSDAAKGGADPSDPNVIYREMARIRDEAGANGAQTGFVHLDRFVRGANGETGFSGPQGANTAYQAVAQPGQQVAQPGQQAAQQTAQQAGATNGTGSGAGGNNVSGYNPGQGGGVVNPGAQAPGAAPPPATLTSVNPSVAQGGNLGQLQGTDFNRLVEMAQNSPEAAAHMLRLAQGQTGPITSTIGRYMDGVYGKAMSAYLSLSSGGTGLGVPGLGTTAQGVNDFYNHLQSGDLYNFLGQQGAKVGAMNFSGMTDDKITAALKAAVALQSLNYGDLGGAQLSSNLNNTLYQNEGDLMKGGQYDSNNLARLLQNSGIAQLMQQYGGGR